LIPYVFSTEGASHAGFDLVFGRRSAAGLCSKSAIEVVLGQANIPGFAGDDDGFE